MNETARHHDERNQLWRCCLTRSGMNGFWKQSGSEVRHRSKPRDRGSERGGVYPSDGACGGPRDPDATEGSRTGRAAFGTWEGAGP